MRRYGLALALTAVLVATAVPAMGYGPWWGGRAQDSDSPRYGRGQGWEGCPYYGYQGSNLTDEQKARLKKIDDEYFRKTSSLHDEMRLKRAELNVLLNSEKPDEAKISDTQKQISSIRDRIDQERIRHQLSVKKVVPDARFGPGPGRGFFRGWGDRPCARI